MKNQNAVYVFLLLIAIWIVVLVAMGFFGNIMPGQMVGDKDYVFCSRNAALSGPQPGNCPTSYQYRGATLTDPQCMDNGICVWNKCTNNCDTKMPTGDNLCSYVECLKTTQGPVSQQVYCNSHATVKCKDGNVWWVDSCGIFESVKEKCSYSCSNQKCTSPKATTTTLATTHYGTEDKPAGWEGTYCYDND